MKFYKTLYYVLNFTWGIVLTLIGYIIALALIITGHKPERWGGCLCFVVGGNWGGFSCGLCTVVSSDNYLLKCHEYGHSIQNAMFGPFNIFLVLIPSVVRYWYRHFKYDVQGIQPKTDYYSIWFEKTASEWGENTIDAWVCK